MIRLNAAEVAIASASLELPDQVRERFAAAAGDGLLISDDDIDLLVDLATDRLMTRGFDARYRPTEEGAALERLIDRLTAEGNDDASDPKQ